MKGKDVECVLCGDILKGTVGPQLCPTLMSAFSLKRVVDVLVHAEGRVLDSLLCAKK